MVLCRYISINDISEVWYKPTFYMWPHVGGNTWKLEIQTDLTTFTIKTNTWDLNNQRIPEIETN